MLTMHTTADTASRTVKQGGRTIGFIGYWPAIKSWSPTTPDSPAGWRFTASKKEVAERYPIPSPVFDDPKAVFRDVQNRLGQ